MVQSESLMGDLHLPSPSLEDFFKLIIRYLVEVNQNFLHWVNNQIIFDGEDLSIGETFDLITANLSDVFKVARLVAVLLNMFLCILDVNLLMGGFKNVESRLVGIFY